tara:strand:+ start:47 stop:505 length:459 start_codon:yes stop_codon:yes gene_type:complete
MELVDGTKEQRPHPEIVMGAMENAGMREEETLQKFLAYALHPNMTQVQVNNTVFMYLAKEIDKEMEAVSSVFNLEAVDSLPNTLLKFLGRMQKRGMAAVTITTIDPNVFRAFVKVQPFLGKSGAKAGIWQHKTKNKFVGRVIFGDKKLEVEL